MQIFLRANPCRPSEDLEQRGLEVDTYVINIPNVVCFAVTVKLIFVQANNGVNQEQDGTRENVSTEIIPLRYAITIQ